MTYLEDGCAKPVIELCRRASSGKECGKMMVQLTAAAIKEVEARNCPIKLQGVRVMDSSQLQQLVQKERPTITRNALRCRPVGYREVRTSCPSAQRCRHEGCNRRSVKEGKCTAHGPTEYCKKACGRVSQRQGYCTKCWNGLKKK